MTISLSENALSLFFLIAPCLYLVNAIIAASFSYKYKKDSIYKKNTYVWSFYLILAVSQGALQGTNIVTSTLLWSIFAFLTSESMSIFISEIFKIKNKIRSDVIFFIFGFISTATLFNVTGNYFISALPAVFFAAYPLLRLAPLLKFFKNNSFAKNGYLICSMAIALHILDYAYAADKPALLFPGYLAALMLATGASCFSFAVLIERAIMEIEIKDLLHNTSRLTALGGMAAEVAHEINTPLTVLSLNNQQILQKLAIGKCDEAYLINKINVADRMTKRLVKIMEALKIGYQSADHDDYRPVTISDIFEDTRVLCDVRTSKFDIKLLFDKNFSDAIINCRSVQITQVLQNLVHNAVDVLENSKEKWIKISVQLKSESQIEILVSDSGPGVPEKIKNKIFDNLFTTKSNGRGTGLGLSISKRFIEDHDGYLRLSDDSENTTFIIGLPIARGSKLSDKKVS